MKAGVHGERTAPKRTVGRNVNWQEIMNETGWRFLKKLKIERLYDPAVLRTGT